MVEIDKMSWNACCLRLFCTLLLELLLALLQLLKIGNLCLCSRDQISNRDIGIFLVHLGDLEEVCLGGVESCKDVGRFLKCCPFNRLCRVNHAAQDRFLLYQGCIFLDECRCACILG